MRSVLHILAFRTDDACLFPCWQRWMDVWMAASKAEGNVDYVMHVERYSSPPNLMRKDRWRHIINARVSFISSLLSEKLPDNSVALFSDLDVVPMRPPSSLLPLPYDITFMREPPGHGGATGRHIVNGGLFAVRNCKRTRRLFGHVKWLLKQRPSLMDQDVLNWILLAPPRSRMHHHNLSWGTWPRELASGLLEDVTVQMAAFHAIFAVDDEAKLHRLGRAFQKHPNAARLLPRCVRGTGLNATCSPKWPWHSDTPFRPSPPVHPAAPGLN